MRCFTTLALLSFLGLASCASSQIHEHSLGSIVALDSPSQGHVCLVGSQVTKGEQLSLYQNVCTAKRKPRGRLGDIRNLPRCERIQRGFVDVVENTDPHLVKVKALGDVALKEGDLVEKMVR